jgi:hypothetical protein
VGGLEDAAPALIFVAVRESLAGPLEPRASGPSSPDRPAADSRLFATPSPRRSNSRDSNILQCHRLRPDRWRSIIDDRGRQRRGWRIAPDFTTLPLMLQRIIELGV